MHSKTSTCQWIFSHHENIAMSSERGRGQDRPWPQNDQTARRGKPKTATLRFAGSLLPRQSSCTAAQRHDPGRTSYMCKHAASHPLDCQSQGQQGRLRCKILLKCTAGMRGQQKMQTENVWGRPAIKPEDRARMITCPLPLSIDLAMNVVPFGSVWLRFRRL